MFSADLDAYDFSAQLLPEIGSFRVFSSLCNDYDLEKCPGADLTNCKDLFTEEDLENASDDKAEQIRAGFF